MRASKFTDAQKAFIIKQGEAGIPAAEICRKAGISQATFFNWKKRMLFEGRIDQSLVLTASRVRAGYPFGG
ncbi:transposase [Hyphomonas sp.]|mgnify:CR=1|jgi:putative transposase|uniref:transposase n=1 Tax=Hyphomonas sp. TaxID=87 RepID=UPI0030030C13